MTSPSPMLANRNFSDLYTNIQNKTYRLFFIRVHGGAAMPSPSTMARTGRTNSPTYKVPQNSLVFQTAELGDVTYFNYALLFYQYFQNPMIEVSLRILQGFYGARAEHINIDILKGFQLFNVSFPGEDVLDKQLSCTADEFTEVVPMNSFPNNDRYYQTKVGVNMYNPNDHNLTDFSYFNTDQYGGIGNTTQLNWNEFTKSGGTQVRKIIKEINDKNKSTLNLIFILSCSVVSLQESFGVNLKKAYNTLGKGSYYQSKLQQYTPPTTIASQIADSYLKYLDTKTVQTAETNLQIFPDLGGGVGGLISYVTARVGSVVNPKMYIQPIIKVNKDLSINSIYEKLFDSLGIEADEHTRRDQFIIYARKLTPTQVSSGGGASGIYENIYLDPDISISDLYSIYPLIENNYFFILYYKDLPTKPDYESFKTTLKTIPILQPANPTFYSGDYKQPYLLSGTAIGQQLMSGVTVTTNTNPTFSNGPYAFEFYKNLKQPAVASVQKRTQTSPFPPIESIQIPQDVLYVRLLYKSDLGGKIKFINKNIVEFLSNYNQLTSSPPDPAQLQSGGKRITRRTRKSKSKRQKA